LLLWRKLRIPLAHLIEVILLIMKVFWLLLRSFHPLGEDIAPLGWNITPFGGYIWLLSPFASLFHMIWVSRPLLGAQTCQICDMIMNLWRMTWHMSMFYNIYGALLGVFSLFHSCIMDIFMCFHLISRDGKEIKTIFIFS